MPKTPRQQPRHYSLQELANLTGMTVRNVRAYQTRGLIPPPERAGRRSVYNESHLQRLKAIKAARDEGATLNLINSHLRRGGALSEESVQLQLSTMREPSQSNGVDRGTSLDPRFSEETSPAAAMTIQRLVNQGVLRRSGNRLIADRALAKGANSAVRQGVSVTNTLAVIESALLAGRQISETIEEALRLMRTDSDASGGNAAAKSRMHLLDLAAVSVRKVTVVDLAAIERRAVADAPASKGAD